MAQQPGKLKLQSERGAALVEFTIVAVLFLTLIFGSVSFGMIFSVKHTLTNAASEGARAALKTNPSATDTEKINTATAAATTRARAGLGGKADYLNPVTASIANCESDLTQRCITVIVSYPYASHPLVPAMPLLNFLPSTLTSKAVIELSS
jgi:Flp pilus assembly protein TadG